MLGLVLMSLSPLAHWHKPNTRTRGNAADGGQEKQASALVNMSRDSTERFKTWHRLRRDMPFNSVRQRTRFGAMGLHYVNGRPSQCRCRRRHASSDRDLRSATQWAPEMIGADFLVIADAWDKKTRSPELMGQLFHYWRVPIASGSRLLHAACLGLGRRTPTARS